LVFTEEISVGGRRLVIKLSPTEKFLREHVSLQSWFVLAGGLLFCSLLGGFLLLVSGRTQHVSDLVDQRTKELAAILENAVESILVVDERGYIQKANPAAAQLFKLPLEDFANSQIASLIPELQPAFIEIGSSLEIGHAKEGVGRCGDGSEVPIEMSISQVEVHDRRLFTFIIHDVTVRRNMDRMKSEFISTVSHELRTPLTSIKGALGIVLSGNLGDVSIKIEDLLVIAKNNVDRLARLVNDILDIDKLEYNQMQFNTQPCVVYTLLKQSIEQNHGYASRYGIQLLLDVPDESVSLLRANLDTDKFLQVMSNLISNAIKFSHPKGSVTVQLIRDGESVRIAVIDRGQGIPEEFRNRIFQKFAQVDSSDTRHRDGTGLGLSITKIIVERLGGSINYESMLGEGTTFSVWFPVVPESL
jgi:PAS domain S-box-containing protein